MTKNTSLAIFGSIFKRNLDQTAGNESAQYYSRSELRWLRLRRLKLNRFFGLP